MLWTHLYSLTLVMALLITSISQTCEANQTGITGKDDRVIVEERTFPWRAIGRVNNAGRGFCTGVLIGERQVLTAGHCLSGRGHGSQLNVAGDIHFLAGYQRGAYLAHSKVIAITQDPARTVQQSISDDWAILTLEQPLGRQLGFLQMEAFDTARWLEDRRAKRLYAQAGYSQDRPHVLTRHSGCPIVRFDPSGDAFAHQCDATHGDSGSPILVKRDDGFHIVGLHVASARQGGSGIAISGSRILARMSAKAPVPRPRGK